MSTDLNELFKLQEELQKASYGISPYELAGEERTMFLKDMTLAGLDEAHEGLGEIGWKPWATSRHVNEEALQGELVDEFHFFMNRCMAAGMTPEILAEKYKAKRLKNAKRQADGYDGVADKCPRCKRALDDEAVLCRKSEAPESKAYWCAVEAVFVW